VAVGGTSGMFPDNVPNPKPKPWSNNSPNTVKFAFIYSTIFYLLLKKYFHRLSVISGVNEENGSQHGKLMVRPPLKLIT